MDVKEALKKLGFGPRFKFKSIQSNLNANNVKTPVDTKEVEISSVEKPAKSHKRDKENSSRDIVDSGGDTVDADKDTVVNESRIRLTSSMVSSSIDESRENSKKAKKRVHQGKNVSNKRVKFTEEQLILTRKKHKIFVWGSDIAEPSESFDALFQKLSSKSDSDSTNFIIDNIRKMNFASPTPIQMQSIPVMLQRREILASAPTGSGKTLAFVIPVLHHLHTIRIVDGSKRIRAVILEPTRELAQQTFHVVERMIENSDLKAYSIKTKKSAAHHLNESSGKYYDILVSTPKTLICLIRKKILTLNHVQWLVVDESDKLFESGVGNMRDQLGEIYKACDNVNLRRAFFSATFSYEVEEWCKLNLDNVITICIGRRNSTVQSVEQELLFTGDEYGKLVALKNMFQRGLQPPVLIFVQTKERAQQLYQELACESTVRVDVIHSDRTQEQRINALNAFRTGHTFVLICTELLGRGIDFKSVNVVINFDFPQSHISYIHRIGRTGRAGRTGKAITFFTEADKVLLRSIANVMKTAGCDVPDYMLKLRKPDHKLKRILSKKGVKRKAIGPNVDKNRSRIRKKKSKIPPIERKSMAKNVKEGNDRAESIKKSTIKRKRLKTD